MTRCKPNGLIAVILLSFLALLLTSCAARQERIQDLVMTEYFLQKAGFQQWAVNDTTPKRQALLDSIPRGKITTFEKGGVTYHVYTDEAAQRLYVGDNAAYQKYVSMTKGKAYCERVTAPDSSQFWSCYNEYQKRGGR